MQVSIEKTEGLERNLNVSIPADEINSKVTSKLKEIGQQVRIKGFRPGKVPKNVLTQRYGKHARQEVLGDIVNSSIQEAIKENKLTLAETPEIKEAKDLDDGGYEFSAKIEVMPEVPQMDYSKIEVENETSEVTDADVEKMISKLQKQKQEWKPSKAKIAKGDLVTVEYSATDGKEFTYPDSGKEKMGILLGESGVPDELIAELVGMKVKESSKINLDFPDVFNVKEMAGKQLDFEFEIVDHKRGKLPKVDEEFVKSFGVDSGNAEDLSKEIKENLQRELANAIEAKMKESVLKALRLKVKDLQLSDKMIARESAALAHQSMDKARQMGIENPVHPDHKEFEELAKEKILNSLIISSVSASQDIKVDYTLVKNKVSEIAQTFENPDQIMEYYYNNPELLASIENTVLETQVVEWIAKQVVLKEKKVAFDKIMDASVS